MVRARHLLKSSALVIFLFGLGKLTGLIRERLVGNAFGTGVDFDAFTAANQLPEVFFALIAGGSLAAAFIPVYAAYLSDQDTKVSTRLANTILTMVIVILGSICALAAIFAPQLAPILVPHFSDDLQQLTASLMRIVLVGTTIFGVSGVLSSILNAHQHFALPALAPLALDIGYGIGLWLFVPALGIRGLAWGIVVGSLLHVAVQVPALVRYGYHYRPRLALQMAGVGEILRLMGPRIVMLGSIQAADLFIVQISSGLETGSTSAYFYGYRLMQLPETLFGTAIALVVFPTLAELYNAHDIIGLKRTAANALRIIWTLTIPAAVGIVMLGQPGITLLLQTGEFDETSTRLVFTVLIVLSLRIISEATLEIVARLFFARHNTMTPMFAYLGWLLVNVAAAFLLVDELGIVGLALASTIAFTLLSAVLFLINRIQLDGLHERELAISAVRAMLAAAGMAAVISVVDSLIKSQLLFLAAGGLAGTLVYFLLHFIFGGREIPALVRLVRQRTN